MLPVPLSAFSFKVDLHSILHSNPERAWPCPQTFTLKCIQLLYSSSFINCIVYSCVFFLCVCLVRYFVSWNDSLQMGNLKTVTFTPFPPTNVPPQQSHNDPGPALPLPPHHTGMNNQSPPMGLVGLLMKRASFQGDYR